MPFPTGWSKRCAITIPAAQVGTGGVTSFTVRFTEDSLPAELFTDARSDGGDIRFSSDSAGASQLAVDLIDYDSGGTALIRVGPVSLSSVSDNTIYLWYGASSETLPAAGDTYGQYAAYDADWKFYTPNGGGPDRTSTGATGTGSGSVPVGGANLWGKPATNYNGSSQEVSYGNVVNTQFGDVDFTVLAEVSPGAASEQGYIVAKNATSDGWGLYWDGSADAVALSRGVTTAGQFSSAVFTDTGPVLVAARHASGGGLSFYRNAVAAGTVSGLTLSASTADMVIGNRPGGTSAATRFAGTVGAVSLHAGLRSPEWITTEYNQTKDPASFASAGTPEDVGGGLTAGTLTEDSHTHNSATLSWTAASGNSGTVSEQLQRSPAGAGTWANVSGATSSPATDTGLDPETAYDYRVAYTDDEETVYSNTVEVTTDATPVPDLSVTVQGGDAVSDGGTDALGTVAQGSSQSRSYTITNDGTATATLGTITVGAGLTITADPSGQTIEPEGTKTLTVSVDTSAVAEIDAAISIPSDDPDSPYNWNLTASVTDQTAPTKRSMRIVGDQFTFRASESVTGDLTQLAFTASGGALTISSGGTFSGNSAVATLSREPAEDETITATLSEPSGIKDAAENEMAGFTDEPVTVGGGSSGGLLLLGVG